MKKFAEYVEQRDAQLQEAGLSNFVFNNPAMGARAVPANPPAAQSQAQPAAPQAAAGPKQVSLGQYASQMKDPQWTMLYDTFTQRHQKFPNDPNNQKLGMALLNAAKSGNLAMLQPFIQQNLHAQPAR